MKYDHVQSLEYDPARGGYGCVQCGCFPLSFDRETRLCLDCWRAYAGAVKALREVKP